MSAGGRIPGGINTAPLSGTSSTEAPEDRTSSFPESSGLWDSRRSTVVGTPSTSSKIDDMVHECDFARPRAKLTIPPRAVMIPEMSSDARPFEGPTFAFGASESLHELPRCPQLDVVDLERGNDYELPSKEDTNVDRHKDKGVDKC
jgi:hypothetical protein